MNMIVVIETASPILPMQAKARSGLNGIGLETDTVPGSDNCL